MRTLVVSDFHLGAGPRHAVLEWPRPRERLLAALAGVQRLVLLGDVVELLERRPATAMVIAQPVLEEVAAHLDPGAEVLLVPGNHDRALIADWLDARAEPLGLDSPVPPDASRELERLLSWLDPATVSVRYPGAWLSERVWATHGHYLDRHLLPDSSYGVARGLLGRPPSDGARPDDYERAGGPSLSRLQALLPAPLRWPLEELLELGRAASMPVAPGRVLSPRLAPITAPVLGFQMRHASIPALARVVHRLGVESETVIFGHVHRLGPLPGEDREQWRGPTGRPRILNCGSWVYEPLLLHHASPPHPYWPGGAVLLEDGQPPRPLGLLDDLELDDMRRAPRLRRERVPRRRARRSR